MDSQAPSQIFIPPVLEEGEGLAETEDEGEVERDTEGDSLTLSLAEGLVELLGLADTDAEGEGDSLEEPIEGLADGDELIDGLTLDEGEMLLDGETEAD